MGGSTVPQLEQKLKPKALLVRHNSDWNKKVILTLSGPDISGMKISSCDVTSCNDLWR